MAAVVAKHGPRNWKCIAAHVSAELGVMSNGRNHVQCAKRWQNALVPGLHKGKWAPEEDALLLRLVRENGTDWPAVTAAWREHGARLRTIKQIRERWNNNVNPKLNKQPFSGKEDATILELQACWGNVWARIAKQLPGRVGEAVKSRYKTLTKKLKGKRDLQMDLDKSAHTSSRHKPAARASPLPYETPGDEDTLIASDFDDCGVILGLESLPAQGQMAEATWDDVVSTVLEISTAQGELPTLWEVDSDS